jgi:hypothetical protein
MNRDILTPNFSNMHSTLSTSCSTAQEKTATFTTSQFVAPRHDEVERERLHPFMMKVHYRNYILDGDGEVVARPLFGLGAHETVEIIQQILKVQPNTEVSECSLLHRGRIITAT